MIALPVEGRRQLFRMFSRPCLVSRGSAGWAPLGARGNEPGRDGFNGFFNKTKSSVSPGADEINESGEMIERSALGGLDRARVPATLWSWFAMSD